MGAVFSSKPMGRFQGKVLTNTLGGFVRIILIKSLAHRIFARNEGKQFARSQSKGQKLLPTAPFRRLGRAPRVPHRPSHPQGCRIQRSPPQAARSLERPGRLRSRQRWALHLSLHPRLPLHPSLCPALRPSQPPNGRHARTRGGSSLCGASSVSCPTHPTCSSILGTATPSSAPSARRGATRRQRSTC